MPLGMDFRTHVSDIITRSDIFLAIIGPVWVNASDDQGRRRLENPADLVRVELESAFAAEGKWIVPVLVGGAEMPQPDELPQSLQKLAYLHAAVVRPDPDFNTDMARLLKALDDGLSRRQQPPKPAPEARAVVPPLSEPKAPVVPVFAQDEQVPDPAPDHVPAAPDTGLPSFWRAAITVPLLWGAAVSAVTAIIAVIFALIARGGDISSNELVVAFPILAFMLYVASIIFFYTVALPISNSMHKRGLHSRPEFVMAGLVLGIVAAFLQFALAKAISPNYQYLGEGAFIVFHATLFATVFHWKAAQPLPAPESGMRKEGD